MVAAARGMKVRDLIRKPPVTVPPTATLLEAAETLTNHGVGAVVVVDPSSPDKPLGILSERDIVKAISAKMPLSTPVEAFMSTDLVTVEAEEPLSRAADLMWMYNIRHLVVVERGKLVGVISVRDLLEPNRRRQLC